MAIGVLDLTVVEILRIEVLSVLGLEDFLVDNLPVSIHPVAKIVPMNGPWNPNMQRMNVHTILVPDFESLKPNIWCLFLYYLTHLTLTGRGSGRKTMVFGR